MVAKITENFDLSGNGACGSFYVLNNENVLYSDNIFDTSIWLKSTIGKVVLPTAIQKIAIFN